MKYEVTVKVVVDTKDYPASKPTENWAQMLVAKMLEAEADWPLETTTITNVKAVN